MEFEKVNEIEISSYKKSVNAEKFIKIPFFKDGKELDSPFRWGITFKSAASMRFRWNEKNDARDRMLSEIAEDKIIAAVELIHSKTVFDLKRIEELENARGDGIITADRKFMPVVTVADCVPVFLCDEKSGVFGVVHSGWKGTGIAGEAVKLFCKNYGARAENICVAVGPHICEKCYKIEKERALYFTENFGKNSVLKNDGEYYLSLTQANLFVLKNAGINPENIVISKDCTCCTQSSDGGFLFGSFRREGASLPPETDNETRMKAMTVQAAFVVSEN